ncbi:hypothetical protein D3C71_1108940 [compost metagenome]
MQALGTAIIPRTSTILFLNRTIVFYNHKVTTKRCLASKASIFFFMWRARRKVFFDGSNHARILTINREKAVKIVSRVKV